MAWNRLVMVMAISCSLTAFGCGDDDGGTDGGGGTDSGMGGTDGGMGTDSGMGTDGGMMCRMPTDYFMGMDACTNADDLAAVMREDYGAMMDQGVADIAATCATGCLADPDQATCNVNCIRMGTDNAVSATCAGCYYSSIACTIDNCITVCLADSSSPACIECRCGAGATNVCMINCIDDVFTACSGIPSDTCTAM